MKRNHKHMWRSVVALILTFTLVFGTASTSFAAMNSGVAPNGEATDSEKTVKYVSLGDSMTNGYGFTGYNQDGHDQFDTTDKYGNGHTSSKEYNYFDGTGTYGQGSYALQFEKYLAEKLGNEVDYAGYNKETGEYSDGLKDGVDHTKMALSALRPEDIYMFLTYEEAPTDDTVYPLKDGYMGGWNYAWNECGSLDSGAHNPFFLNDGTSCGETGYQTWFLDAVMDSTYDMSASARASQKEQYTNQFVYMHNYFVEKLTDADIISLALGNASFDAYFMDRLFKIWKALYDDFNYGKYGSAVQNIQAEMKLEDVYELADKEIVDMFYDTITKVVASYMSGEDYTDLQMDRVCQLMTYVTFSYMYSYKQIIEWIGENNPDAEIMIVGMLNSHYGLTASGVGEEPLNFGDTMGAVYDLMNTYVAGMCADYQEKNTDFTGKLYYVEQPDDPEMIATVVGDLDKAGWGLIDCGIDGCEYCANGEACPNGRLDGEIVRVKTIPVFNQVFAGGGLGYWYAGAKYTNGMASSDQELLAAVQTAIDDELTVVEFFNKATNNNLTAEHPYWDNNTVGALGAITANVIYLACEKAMVKSLESSELELSALVAYADGSMAKRLEAVDKTILPTNKVGTSNQAGWATVNVPTEDKDGNKITLKYIYDYFYDFYTSDEMLPLIRFFAINKVGNGIAAHPTPSNHDRTAASVIAAYENGYTVQDKCADESDMVVANEIYYALSEAGLLTTEQTNAIIDYFVDVMLGEKSSDGAVDYLYDMLLRDESRTAAQKIETIGIIYNAVNEAGYLTDYAKALGAIEEIYTYLDSKDYISDEQSFAIVDCVYNALMNDGKVSDKEVKAIALFIYNTLTGTKEAIPVAPNATSGSEMSGSEEMSASDKLDVINKVYDVLKAYGYLDDVTQMKDLKEIFDIIAADDEETAVEVFEIVFYGMMESDELTEEKQAEIIDDVYTAVMKSDKLSPETKMTVVEKVTALVGGSATDLPEKPELVVNALRAELKASGYFTDEQLVDIINIVYDLVTSNSDDERAELTEKLYDSILGRDDLSFEQKVEIITIVYNVLDQYGYVDYAINKAVYLVYEYYDEAYEYAYDYAEKEGYIDATIDGIKEVEKALKVALDEAKTTGMSDELKAELEAAYEGAMATTAQLEKLILEADVLDDATYAEALALLTTLEGNLNDFCSVAEQVGVDTVKQLKKAYEYLKPIVIEKLKEAVKAGAEWLLDKLVKALPEIDKALYDWFYENPETVIGFFVEYSEEIKAITDKYGDEALAVLLYVLSTYGPEAVEWALENPEEAIAKWVKWYNKHGHKVWPMIDKYLETMDEMGMFDELKAAAAELEAYVIAYAEKVVAELEAKINELNDAAKAALEELKAAIEAVDVDAILAALEELYDAGVAVYEGATSGYYAATEDSYYVALGDTNVEYAEIVAEELDLEKDQFVNYGIEDMTAAELKAYLNAGDEDLIAEIENADLITLGFSNNTITKFAADKLAAVMAGEEVEMDWTPYVGKEGAAAMAKAIAAIEEELAAEGADKKAIDMASTVVEAYAFACTEFACNYPEAINAIKEINPEAQVVVVGMYNPFENAVLDIEGTQIPVGDYVGVLVDLANVHYTSYAILTGNAVYVHAPAVETKAPFEEAMDITGFASVLTDMDSLEPSAAGHQYIAEQILDAMNVVSKAVYDAQKLIDEIKAFGEVTRDNLADAKALAEAARAAWDKLTEEEKALIGLDNYKLLVDFELAVAKVELGVAEDIAAAEKALAEAQAKAAEVERALKITESTVANLKAKVVNKSQIKVTWKAPETTPDQYRVTLLRAGKKVGTYWVAGDKETVTLKNLLRGTNFTVRVTPVAKVDGKKYFSIYKTSNKVKTQLQKANLTVKKAGLKKQIISKDQNSTGFQIYISQDKNFKKNVKKLVYQTNKKGLNVKVKAKNFKKGTNYVKVRAYTKVNGKKVYGAWSGTVKVVK